MRTRLVDAQVEVLRIYLEKRSNDRLLEALDRLIECTYASFREEEALMDCFSPAPDPVHREMHTTVLAQLEMLRDGAMNFDRGRLLAQLILIDRQLTLHISDAAPIRDSQQPDHVPENAAPQGRVAENQH